jgi:hypothetical protein
MNRRSLFTLIAALPMATFWATRQSKAIPANSAANQLHNGNTLLPENGHLPTKEILEVANEIREHLSPLPAGVFINSCINTGNVFIHTEELGFVITVDVIGDSHDIENKNYLEVAKETLPHLMLAIEQNRKCG